MLSIHPKTCYVTKMLTKVWRFGVVVVQCPGQVGATKKGEILGFSTRRVTDETMPPLCCCHNGETRATVPTYDQRHAIPVAPQRPSWPTIRSWRVCNIPPNCAP